MVILSEKKSWLATDDKIAFSWDKFRNSNPFFQKLPLWNLMSNSELTFSCYYMTLRPNKLGFLFWDWNFFRPKMRKTSVNFLVSRFLNSKVLKLWAWLLPSRFPPSTLFFNQRASFYKTIVITAAYHSCFALTVNIAVRLPPLLIFSINFIQKWKNEFCSRVFSFSWFCPWKSNLTSHTC